MNQIKQKTDPFEPPALILDLPAPTYFSIPAASSHFLRTLLTESPLHAKARPDTPSAAKDLGSIAHALILEPERSAREVRVKPAGANRASNDGKGALVDFYCQALGRDLPQVEKIDPATGKAIAPGKVLDAMLDVVEPDALLDDDIQITSQDDFEAAQRMRDSVMKKPLGQALFDGGRSEVTILAARPYSGALCKIRVDWIPDAHEVLVDLKSAADATDEGFGRSAASYGYHFQAAFYRAVESWYRGSLDRKPFIFVVVENTPPYDSNFLVLDTAPQYVFGGKALAVADAQWKRALDIYEECVRRDFWPGLMWNWLDDCYNVMPSELVLPGWSLK